MHSIISCIPYSMQYEPGGKLCEENLNYFSITLFFSHFRWWQKKKYKTDNKPFQYARICPDSQVCHCWPSFQRGFDFLSNPVWVVIVIGKVLELEKSWNSWSRVAALGPSPDTTCRPRAGHIQAAGPSLTSSRSRLWDISGFHQEPRCHKQKVSFKSQSKSLCSALFSELWHFYPCLTACWKKYSAHMKQP